MDFPVIVRTRVARFVAGGVIVLATAIAFTMVFQLGWGQLWRVMPLWLLCTFGAWATLWRPCLFANEEVLRLVNVLETVEIPWSQVRAFDSRYTLSVETPQGTFSAWAVPAGSGMHKRASIFGKFYLSPRIVDPDAAESAPVAMDLGKYWEANRPFTQKGSSGEVLRSRHFFTAVVLAAATIATVIVPWIP